MPNNNGDFFTCMREVEEDLDSDDAAANRRALRKFGTHIIRMHQQLEDMIEAHTGPDGKLFDVKQAYSNLTELSTDMKDMRRLLWTAQIGVYLFGAMAPVVIGLGVYAWHGVQKANEQNTRINHEQTVMLERIQTIQQSVVQQLQELRRGRPPMD